MPSSEIDVLTAQLLACRAQIDATLAYLGCIEAVPAENVCSHPETQRKALPGTMGQPQQYECQVCNETVTVVPVTEPNAAPAAAGA